MPELYHSHICAAYSGGQPISAQVKMQSPGKIDSTILCSSGTQYTIDGEQLGTQCTIGDLL